MKPIKAAYYVNTEFNYSAILTTKIILEFLENINENKLSKFQQGDVPNVYLAQKEVGLSIQFTIIMARRDDDKIIATAEFFDFAAACTTALFLKRSLDCIRNRSQAPEEIAGLVELGEDFPVECALFVEYNDAFTAQNFLTSTLKAIESDTCSTIFNDVFEFARYTGCFTPTLI